MRKRRAVNPIGPSAQRPHSSGPRWARACPIALSTVRGVEGCSLKLRLPAMPHIETRSSPYPEDGFPAPGSSRHTNSLGGLLDDREQAQQAAIALTVWNPGSTVTGRLWAYPILFCSLGPAPIRLLRTPSTPHAARESERRLPTPPACAPSFPRYWARAHRSGCCPETRHRRAAAVRCALPGYTPPLRFFLWES